MRPAVMLDYPNQRYSDQQTWCYYESLQSYALFPHIMSAFPLRLRKVEKQEIERRGLQKSWKWCVWRFWETLYSQIAPGGRQRVVIARAIVTNRGLLADELIQADLKREWHSELRIAAASVDF